MATSQQSEIKELHQQARKQGFEVEQVKGGHFHVTRGDKRVVMSVSPSSSNASRRARDDMVKAGLVLNGKTKNASPVDLGAEGTILFCLSNSEHPRSAHSLSRATGIKIGTVNSVLTRALGKFPNLHHEHTLWSWDPDDDSTISPLAIQETALTGSVLEGDLEETTELDSRRSFTYPLRPDGHVTLLLPPDVKGEEMKKVMQWIKYIKTA